MSKSSILDGVTDKDIRKQEISTPRRQLMDERDRFARIWLKRYFEFLKENTESFDPAKIMEFNKKYPKSEITHLKWLLTKGVNLLKW